VFNQHGWFYLSVLTLFILISQKPREWIFLEEINHVIMGKVQKIQDNFTILLDLWNLVHVKI
jgi:hypothetical protein